LFPYQLETDEDIIKAKARDSLVKYDHQVVISNLLATRRKQVTLVTKSEETSIILTDSDLSVGVDIERKIVNDLTHRHRIFIEQTH
jgi:phosphopantothenate-cysteine ligase